MTKHNVLTAFEIEINKIDDVLNKPVTKDSFYWLQQAAVRFAKTRFNGSAPKFTSFEQTEKRYKDLAGLIKMNSLTPTETKPAGIKDDSFDGEILAGSGTKNYYCTIPDNIMYMLTENVTITDLQGTHPYTTGVFECTTDNYSYRITNSLTDFHYKHHRARPLRVRLNTAEDGKRCVELITDGKYNITKYVITYLVYPDLNYDALYGDEEMPFFTDDVWTEIIKLAAQMYVENQQDPRYRTLTDQVLSLE